MRLSGTRSSCVEEENKVNFRLFTLTRLAAAQGCLQTVYRLIRALTHRTERFSSPTSSSSRCDATALHHLHLALPLSSFARAMPPAHTDTWPSATHADWPSAPATPSKRASRSSRISNDTDYRSFTRSTCVGGTETTVEFRVGDTVVVGADAKLKQKFLAPPSWQVEAKGKGKGKKGKGRGKKRSQDDEEDGEPEGWRHEDGLNAGDKVAVITRLFEDVRGRKMALVRWFARPGAVWGPDGPDEDDDAGDVLPVRSTFQLIERFSPG